MATPYARDDDLLRDILVPLVFFVLIFTVGELLWSLSQDPSVPIAKPTHSVCRLPTTTTR